ncbi:MAG: hypothetical protein BWX80_03719 [Candidatus Hydrogenedentes bacterium ADurb.Bin101]|nr:MAG: hypothetical protein BWX80_03719 [Candidatus Hydrogenedentes bacterium ADurb.Bin101]
MTGLAVAQHVQEHGTTAVLQHFQFALVRIGQGEGVVAIDDLCVHLFRIYGRCHPGEIIEAHGFADGLAAHAVKVVHKIEQHRKAAPDKFRPKGFKLGHG